MRSVVIRFLALAAVAGALAVEGAAQGPSASTTDPRVGLKPGFRDAGVAARNMELVASMPKPDGFFDPKSPEGIGSAPEPPPAAVRSVDRPPRSRHRRRAQASS